MIVLVYCLEKVSKMQSIKGEPRHSSVVSLKEVQRDKAARVCKANYRRGESCKERERWIFRDCPSSLIDEYMGKKVPEAKGTTTQKN